MLKKVTWQDRFTHVLGLREWAALGAGGLLTYAFAPMRWWWLAPVCLAVLYYLWQTASPGRLAWRGFLFGVGVFGLGVSWVYLTLARFGGMPEPLAGLATFLFVSILAAYPAIAGYLYGRLCRSGLFNPFLFASLWTLTEWVRGFFLTGFPWLDIGYSQASGPLMVWAPLVGVVGITFIVALLAAGAVEIMRKRRLWLISYALVAALTSFAEDIVWVHPVAHAITVSLVQGNVSPYVKWDPRENNAIIAHYMRLSNEADGQLVIWPETAVPDYSVQLRRYFIPMLHRLAHLEHRHFLFGVVEGNPVKVNAPVYNAVMSVGRTDGYYRKRHLVPFGEYLPWPSLFNPILQILHIPMSGFTAWPHREPALPASGARVGLSICYEIAYASIVTQALPQATLFVNVSDDSWYGHSAEARQQFEIAQMRAAEAGREMAVATNNGITGLINEKGAVVARLPPFHSGVLTVVAQPYAGLTPYDRYGKLPTLVVCFAMLFLGLGRRLKALNLRPL